jgi:hypothetical protein
METPATPFEKPKNVPLQWTAPRHPHHERTKTWYIGMGAFVALCLAYALWTAGWSFAVVIVLIGVAYAGLHRTPAAMGTLRIDEEGCTWDGTLIPWERLKDFWILRLPEYNEVHIARRRGILEIIVQTGDIGVPELRATLSQFLPERPDQAERLIDRIIRLTKL